MDTPSLRDAPTGAVALANPAPSRTTLGIVGRETELHLLDDFLGDAVQTPSALVLGGIPGIGKTILWSHGVIAGGQEGHLVLSARPSQPETALSYSALGDLLSNDADEAIASLAGPQRHALEVALLRSNPGPRPPNQRAIGVALLGVLRTLSRDRPVLLAVDDVQWLDAPTARVLEYALRRLAVDSVKILLSERRDRPGVAPLGLDSILPQDRLRRVEVASLSLAAIQHILATLLGAPLTHSALLRIHETSGGNPFYALELGRALIRSGARPRPGEPLPVPHDLSNLVADRLAALPIRTRTVLFAVAALALPRMTVLQRTFGEELVGRALERASSAAVIETAEDLVRFTHPLLASLAYECTSKPAARRIHQRLANALSDPEERARHLALAVDRPDEDVATILEKAAQVAHARGAPDAAADLSELASRLTPAGLAGRTHHRTFTAAAYRYIAGDMTQARSLSEHLVETMPSGRARAEALWLLGLVWFRLNDLTTSKELFDQAALEAKGDLVLQARATSALASLASLAGDGERGLALGQEALRKAQMGGDDLTLEFALEELAGRQMRFGGGRQPLALIDRALALKKRGMKQPGEERSPLQSILAALTTGHAESIRGMVLISMGNLEEARPWLLRALQATLEAPNESELPRMLDGLSELEYHAGNWELADSYAQREWDAIVQSGQQLNLPSALESKAQVAACRGEIEKARALAVEAKEVAQRGGTESLHDPWVRWFMGFLDLHLGPSVDAVRHFRLYATAYLAGEKMGAHDVYWVPDAVEVLTMSGDFVGAENLLERFERDDRWRDSPLPLATAMRCRALLEAAQGDIEGAVARAQLAVAAHERLSMPFELARALLLQGTILRRAKHKRSARESLNRSLAILEGLGARLWADRVRSELGRLGLRPRAPLELTFTEQKVAELSASGLTNRQVAEALFMSPKTVEWNLAKIYRKLGVGSRAQLASKFHSDQIQEAGKPNT